MSGSACLCALAATTQAFPTALVFCLSERKLLIAPEVSLPLTFSRTAEHTGSQDTCTSFLNGSPQAGPAPDLQHLSAINNAAQLLVHGRS